MSRKELPAIPLGRISSELAWRFFFFAIVEACVSGGISMSECESVSTEIVSGVMYELATEQKWSDASDQDKDRR